MRLPRFLLRLGQGVSPRPLPLATAVCLTVPGLVAQTPGGVLPAGGVTATVVDPAGAKVPHAEVLVFLEGNTDGAPIERAQTGSAGQVSLALPAGTYAVEVSASGFVRKQQTLRVGGKAPAQITIRLAIQTKDESVTVMGEDGSSGGGESSGDALVLRGDRLRTLSDDPTTLQQQLNALVSTDDGSAPQLRVDGFSNGRLPSKSAIREIRVNQNAFSAQFDQRGNTVLDIFTKPGTDKLHGYMYVSGDGDVLNARNPYIAPQPPYNTLFLDGSINGPLNKSTSFFAGVNRNENNNNAAVNAVVLDENLNATPFSQAVPNPSVTNSFNVRIDHSFGASNTFTGRLDVARSHQVNTGVGELVLSSQGLTSESQTSTLQLGNTTVAGPHAVVESRFQYRRLRLEQTPASTALSLVVQGSFTGGGNNGQTLRDAQDSYEWQEYLSLDRGKHFLRGGLRYRLTRDSNSSTAGYNGQYTFPTLQAYQTTVRGLAAGLSQSQIRAAGGGASQYYVTTGTPNAVLLTGDLGAYVEDEWRVRPTFTLTSGLRFESQFGIPDHMDPAPRLGFLWQISRKKGTVPVVRLRGGVGVFYDRFPAGNLLIATRQNGVLQSSFYVQNPDYLPNGPSAGAVTLVAAAPSIYQVAPNLRSPYVISEGIGVERRVSRFGSVSVNFTNERGVHQFLSRNANAPLNGARPLGGTQNVYQYAAEGTSNTRTLSANTNLQFGQRVGMWGSYVLRFRQTNTSGLSSFVSNSYDINADYGRTGFLTRHRFFLGSWVRLPWNFSSTMFLSAHSSTRFNITTGQDNNGDSIFNDRPAFATDLTRASVVRTPLGNFDTAPMAGQTIIPVNYGKAPAFLSLQMQMGRSFAFGPLDPVDPNAAKLAPGAKAPPRDRLYHFYLGVQAQNLLNTVNPATPVGQLSSPYFGRSLTLNGEQTGSTAANRVLSLFGTLNF